MYHSYTMIVQYCSDLHLEFPINKMYLKEHPLNPKGEVLLLAGDVVPFAKVSDHGDFFDFVSENFKQVFWVPGNHEYYKWDIRERGNVIHEAIRSNVFLVNNCSVHYEGIQFIFSTLWSKISPAKEEIIRQFMADFRLIKNNNEKLSFAAYNELHEVCKSFLMNETKKEKNGKRIIVSHHIPTYLNYPEKFRDSKINEAFAVELRDFIETSQADYWISGHTHEVVPDFKIGITTLTSNQLGYVEYHEHNKFRFDKAISL
jgi:predicted phosphohydrolase